MSKSEQSRKRGATELDEGRSVKAPKREPQEDLPLLTQIEASITADHSPTYPTPLSAHPLNGAGRAIAPFPHSHSHSQPPSRAPSPPEAPRQPRQSFSSSRPNPPPSFPNFVPSSPAVEFPPKIPGGPQWNDPAVSSSRHHHSLSAGSITSPLQTISIAPGVNPAIPHPLEGFTPGISPMVTPATSNISPPIGRMSRSGSITGVSYNNQFSFNYLQNEAPTWSTYSQKTHNLPPTPQSSRSQSQSNWYFGPSDYSAPSGSPSTTSDVSSTMAGTAPNTTRSSPTDPEDNDDDHDSDGSEHRMSHGKKVGTISIN